MDELCCILQTLDVQDANSLLIAADSLLPVIRHAREAAAVPVPPSGSRCCVIPQLRIRGPSRIRKSTQTGCARAAGTRPGESCRHLGGHAVYDIQHVGRELAEMGRDILGEDERAATKASQDRAASSAATAPSTVAAHAVMHQFEITWDADLQCMLQQRLQASLGQ